MASKYQELQDRIAKLQKEAEQARQEEVGKIIQYIKTQIAEFDLTASDLGFSSSKGGSRATVAPKFRDPKSGKTWTGRGRAPKWIAEHEAAGGSREEFAI